jgi:hypothetical protein
MESQRVWKNSGLSIVVLPSGEQANQLERVAREWTALRLLIPTIWVRPEDVSKPEGAPPKVPATVIASTRSGECREQKIDLFELLAAQQLSTVRLIVVRPNIPGTDFDAVQDEFVHLVSPYLEFATPKLPPSKETDGDGIKLLKINLITGPTEHVMADAEPALDQLFNVHFVPSSEDRRGPRTGDAFVRYEPESLKFAGFTLLHLATIGAIWVGLPKGAYELAGKEVWEGDSVYVSRVFASAILTDGLIRRACARVLETIADSRGGIQDLGVGLNINGTYPIQDSEIEAWLDYMVGLTFNFDNQVLQYQPALESPTPQKFRFGFLGQLRDFFGFAGGKLARVPYYAWLWMLQSAANFFNRLFQRGDKGAAEVVVKTDKPDPLDKALLAKFEQVSEAKKLAEQALVSPVGRSNLRSTPGLWANLRQLVFGFLDSSNLDKFGIPRSDNGWPIFYSVRSVFQDPSEKLVIQDPIDEEANEFGWGESVKGEEFLKRLNTTNLALKEKMQVELSDIVAAKAKIVELEGEIAKASNFLGLANPLQSVPPVSENLEQVESSPSSEVRA